jgi:hypothetical protein
LDNRSSASGENPPGFKPSVVDLNATTLGLIARVLLDDHRDQIDPDFSDETAGESPIATAA